MKRTKAVLPHVCIVLSFMFLVFLVLDDCNPVMDFLTSPLSNALLASLCAASLLDGVLLVCGAGEAGSRERRNGGTAG